MKELKKISKFGFNSKMMLHKVIFIPITTALRILHFNDMYVIFWTPSTSHIQISKITTPKTLLSQMAIYRLIRSIYKNLRHSVIYLRGYLSKMGKTDFYYTPPAWHNKSPKLTPRQIFLHRGNIITMVSIWNILLVIFAQCPTLPLKHPITRFHTKTQYKAS